MRNKILLTLLAITAVARSADAATLTLSGYLDDPGNPALVWSDLGPALFGDDNEIANNVALYEITVPVAGVVTFTSLGWAQGGAEPYFSLFQGTGPTATFLDSNYFDPNIDFTLTEGLAAGTYTAAIGVWFNMSFAENNPDPDPSLGDGFIQLGDPSRLGNAYYEVRVDLPDAGVPEPTTLLLLVSGVGLVVRRRRA